MNADVSLAGQLAKRSLLRRIGTVADAKGSGYRIYARDSEDVAQWIPEGGQLPVHDGQNDFTRLPVDRHKLGAIVKMEEDFVNDSVLRPGGAFDQAIREELRKGRG